MLEHYAGIATLGYHTTNRVESLFEGLRGMRNCKTLEKRHVGNDILEIVINCTSFADFFQPTPGRNFQNSIQRTFAPSSKRFIGAISVIGTELERERSNVTKSMKHEGLFQILVLRNVHFFALTKLFESETFCLDSAIKPQSQKVFTKVSNGWK